MKVILKSKMKNLGNIGDIIEVKDGYARNMLIPNDLAIFYTEKNYEVFKKMKEDIEKKNQEEKKKAEDLASQISIKDLILIENASDDGRLYGSITTIKVANFINDLMKTKFLKKNNISLKDQIREVGKYTVIVQLHPEVSIEKSLIVARTKEEAIKIKKGEFKLEKKNKIEDEVVANDTVSNEPKKEKKKSKKENKEETEKTENTEEK